MCMNLVETVKLTDVTEVCSAFLIAMESNLNVVSHLLYVCAAPYRWRIFVHVAPAIWSSPLLPGKDHDANSFRTLFFSSFCIVNPTAFSCILNLTQFMNHNTGWPRKNGTGYFPHYVDAITGISVWDNFSWEKWYQDQQFGSVVCFLSLCEAMSRPQNVSYSAYTRAEKMPMFWLAIVVSNNLINLINAHSLH